jgi:Protein of unknown function (DUF3037)
MSELTDYTYTVLRYVHDIATGEFVNVGVVLYAPKFSYLEAKTRSTYGRLTRVFPDMDGDAFKRAMSHVERSVASTAKCLNDLFRETDLTALELATRTLVSDDSSLQWSPLGSGRTKVPAQELERLFDKFVLQYDRTRPNSRSDEEVWKSFSRALENRQVLTKLEQKEIVSDVDRMTFRQAWKNSHWHCLEPLSFDFAEGERIHKKATQWAGQMLALANAPERFKIYLLVGEPTRADMQSYYHRALRILETIPIASEIVQESQADALADRIAGEIRSHESRVRDADV